MEGIMIKEAAKLLKVEAHVLRYWEEELGLKIKRNSMGHRYYDERDIKMFNEVKELKSKGLTLKDIKQGIDRHRKTEENPENVNERQSNEAECGGEPDVAIDKSAEAVNNVVERDFRELIIAEEGNNDEEMQTDRHDTDKTGDDKIVDFKLAQMQTVMNKVIANALRENRDIITSSIKSEITEDVMKQFDTVMREQEERQEERYRKLDTCLRQIQQANEEVAATRVRKRFGKRRFAK